MIPFGFTLRAFDLQKTFGLQPIDFSTFSSKKWGTMVT